MRFRKDGIDLMARVNAARDIFAAVPGIWTRNRAEESLAPKKAWKPVQPSLPTVAISMVFPSETPPPPRRHHYLEKKHHRASYRRPAGFDPIGRESVQAAASAA